jgi:hypothetical protein
VAALWVSLQVSLSAKALLPICYQIRYRLAVWFNMIRHGAIQSTVANTRVIIDCFAIMLLSGKRIAGIFKTNPCLSARFSNS